MLKFKQKDFFFFKILDSIQNHIDPEWLPFAALAFQDLYCIWNLVLLVSIFLFLVKKRN